MDRPSRGPSNIPLPEFNSSPLRRSLNMFSDQAIAGESAEGMSNQRPLTSRYVKCHPFNGAISQEGLANAGIKADSCFTVFRRRRFLGRLARSGSDSRQSTNSHFNPDAPSFVPGSILKMSTKRKASSQADSSKSPQFCSSTNVNAGTLPTDLPLIKTEDIVSPKYHSFRANQASSIHEYMDSSDEDVDMFELSNLTTATLDALEYGPRHYRNKLEEEVRRRPEAGGMTSVNLGKRRNCSTECCMCKQYDATYSVLAA